YNTQITDSLKLFLRNEEKDFIELQFEDLLLRPDSTLADINTHLDITLSIDDLKTVYNGRLYRKSKDFMDKLKATAIYLKNYGERYR
ncbi:hypothetical protein N9878_02720, partial [bacterium]|nr:hypothetical protein [bacterium]